MAKRCTHLDQIHSVKPSSKGCEECIKMGHNWGIPRVSLLRQRRLLRFLEKQARHETFSRRAPCHHALDWSRANPGSGATSMS